MRATIIGTKENFEVLAEEFKIPGTDERFIVHHNRDIWHSQFVATHLETGQIIGDGETIDAAIAEGTRRWLASDPDETAKKLVEQRAWAAERIAERMGAS